MVRQIMHLAVPSIIVLSIILGARLPSSAQSDDTTTLVAGQNTFAFDFYQEVTSGENINLVFSPFSITQAFGMLMGAARENSEAQIAETMHYTLPQDALHPAFAALNADLAAREAPGGGEGERLQLNIANSIWAQDGFPFLTSYTDLLQENYDGGLRLMDFIAEPENARNTINDWIEQETENKIQDMIPSGGINEYTRMVLVNAIYFNGSWLHPFDDRGTQDQPFMLLDGSTVTVPTMMTQETFGYLEGDGFQAVELPYFGGDMAMLVVLPDAGQFDAIQAQLDSAFFDTTRQAIGYRPVLLHMPRFEFETDISLSSLLQNMGMTDVFDPDAANLTGMFDPSATGENLFVTAALHRAYIGVDEAGTEAAAATAILMGTTSLPPEPVEVKLDRPFIYAIYDRQTGAILFLGQVMNPAG